MEKSEQHLINDITSSIKEGNLKWSEIKKLLDQIYNLGRQSGYIEGFTKIKEIINETFNKTKCVS